LLALINDILDLSKIEAGRLVTESGAFDLHATVKEVFDMVSVNAHQKGLDLRLHYPSEVPPHLIGDAGRIRQVLTNLVINAVKFTPAGSVTVDVCQLPPNGSGVRIRIAVTDTGSGIPEDKRQFLFQKFMQLDSSLTRQNGGTGLGLAICKDLVQLMGGEIGAESRPGEGATFWFSLPLGVAPRNAATAKPSRPSDHVVDEFAESGIRILVVEDNAVNLKVAVRMLQRLGLRADVAADGTEAVQMYDLVAYDLILMDCQMPQMDGFTASRAIRRKSEGGRQPVILALTAETLDGSRERCLDAGMNDYLSKPVTLAALTESLRKWIPAAENAGVPAARQ
jgi:CheY-like chemotaxis protein